ncbi:MAG: M56 family metallopeptidase, partial [Planctomycetota bacterium]
MTDFAIINLDTFTQLLRVSTVLMLIGAIVAFFQTHAAMRQRVAEIALGITMLWLALAWVPLPRIDRSWFKSSWESVERGPTLQDVAESELGERSEAIVDPRMEALPNSIAISDEDASNNHRTAMAPSLSWPAAAIYGCLAVGGCLLAWMLLARFVIYLHCTKSASPPSWLEEIYDEMRKRRGARILISPRGIRPMSFGFLRPTILLPIELIEQSQSRQVRHVLLHEQAHIDRADALGNLVVVALLPVLWFHPLYWYLRGVICYT